MIRVGIREAKAQLSKLLRNVLRGEEIVITERGNPIAKIVPLKTAEETVEQWAQGLIAQGLLELADPGARMPRPLSIPPSDVMQRILQEDRESGY